MTIYKIYRMTVEVKSCQNLVGKGRHPNPTTPHLHHPQHTAESTRDSPPISVNMLAQAKRKGRGTKPNQEKCRRGTKEQKAPVGADELWEPSKQQSWLLKGALFAASLSKGNAEFFFISSAFSVGLIFTNIIRFEKQMIQYLL